MFSTVIQSGPLVSPSPMGRRLAQSPPVKPTAFPIVQDASEPTFPLLQHLQIPSFFPSDMSLYCYKSSPHPRISEIDCTIW